MWEWSKQIYLKGWLIQMLSFFIIDVITPFGVTFTSNERMNKNIT